MGPAHSTNDIGVWLPEQKVMFAGDLAFSGGHPIFLEGSLDGFRSAVRRMRDLAPAALLPGHGPACRGDEVGKVLDDLEGYVDWIAELAPRVVRRRADAVGGGAEGRRRPVHRLAGGRAGGVQPAPRLRRAEPDYESPVTLNIPSLWPEMVALNGGPIETHA